MKSKHATVQSKQSSSKREVSWFGNSEIKAKPQPTRDLCPAFGACGVILWAPKVLHCRTPAPLHPCSSVSCSTQPCLWRLHSTPVAAFLDGCPLVLASQDPGISAAPEGSLLQVRTVASPGTQCTRSAVRHGSLSHMVPMHLCRPCSVHCQVLLRFVL